MVEVIKKDGRVVPFEREKIENAVRTSAERVLDLIDETKLQKCVDKAVFLILTSGPTEKVPTSFIHTKVEQALAKEWRTVYNSYSSYRDYRKKQGEMFNRTQEDSYKILTSGDKENANKDSFLNSTKQSLVATRLMKEFMSNEMDKSWLDAHEKGWLHIHDLGERWLRQQNCCLFNMGDLLSGGFNLNGEKYIEPKHFDSAISVIGDVTLFASAQQYGK